MCIRDRAISAGQKLQALLQGYLQASTIANGAHTVVSVFSMITNTFVNFVIVLILAFYMTLDGPKIAKRALSYFPPVVREIASDAYAIINRKFGGYLRGQIILAASYGALTYVVAVSFGLQFQIFIAAFAAIMMLIPFIGTFLALIPPIIFFIAANPSFPFAKFLLFLAVLIATQQIVINLLAPRVMGSAVGMHPLLVVLGLLLGVQVAGLWGAIFGVPIFGAIVETTDLIYRRVMGARFSFRPGEVDDASAGDGPAQRHGTGTAPPDHAEPRDEDGAA